MAPSTRAKLQKSQVDDGGAAAAAAPHPASARPTVAGQAEQEHTPPRPVPARLLGTTRRQVVTKKRTAKATARVILAKRSVPGAGAGAPALGTGCASPSRKKRARSKVPRRSAVKAQKRNTQMATSLAAVRPSRASRRLSASGPPTTAPPTARTMATGGRSAMGMNEEQEHGGLRLCWGQLGGRRRGGCAISSGSCAVVIGGQGPRYWWGRSTCWFVPRGVRSTCCLSGQV